LLIYCQFQRNKDLSKNKFPSIKEFQCAKKKKWQFETQGDANHIDFKIKDRRLNETESCRFCTELSHTKIILLSSQTGAFSPLLLLFHSRMLLLVLQLNKKSDKLRGHTDGQKALHTQGKNV
jgi:hypothetical protein